jgi:hypothetical protein
MPDGRILVPSGGTELTLLQPNGWVDLGFATSLSNQFVRLRSVQVLSDGRILVTGNLDYLGHPAPRLVRLLPNGALDAVFTISNFTGIATAQLDGTVLDGSTLSQPMAH